VFVCAIHHACADEHLGHGEKADYIDCKATITYIKSDPDPWYRACTNGDCKRKVTEEMGGWRCEKCQRTMPECAYR
jgi:replication factor A1